MRSNSKKEFVTGSIKEFVGYVTSKYKSSVSWNRFYKEFEEYFTIDVGEACEKCYFFENVLEEMYLVGWDEDFNKMKYYNKKYKGTGNRVRNRTGQQELELGESNGYYSESVDFEYE